MNQYITNEDTGEVLFSERGTWSPQYMNWETGEFIVPYRISIQAEIDSLLLEKSKSSKLTELIGKRDALLANGITYTGAIVVDVWDINVEYHKHALVKDSNGDIYKSLESGNIGNDPATSPVWNFFQPVFTMTTCCMTNLTVKSGLNGAPNRYKFFTKTEADGYRHFIDFGNLEEWNSFVLAVRSEENRIMEKYCAYASSIAICTTVAEVDAIVINFDT